MRFVDVLLLTVLLAGALAWPLHAPPIAAHGEAREGLVVQDVALRGEWTLPRRNGELPSKPPLFHWMAAAAARVFGLTDATVRAPSAIAAWVTLLATFALGTAIGGRVSGWIAAGALFGMAGFWQSAWEARVDMVFVAAITVALVAFFAWYRRGGAVTRACCYAATACAVLAKGPAGAALPGLIVLAFVARESWRRHRGPAGVVDGVDDDSGRDADDAAGVRAAVLAGAPVTLGAGGAGPLAHLRAVITRFWSWPLVALVALVDVGWYALAYRRGGVDFLTVQLLHENVDRLVGRGVFGMHGGRSRFDMITQLATDVLPWNLVLVASAVAWVRGARADLGARFLHAWWLVVVAVFTAAYGKRDIYLLPLYPALALLAGRALAAATTRAPAGPVLGVVPVPAALRRRFPTRPALALVALAIVTFDATVVAVFQIARLHDVRRHSLLAFVRDVEAHLPADATLYAAHDLDGSDLQVLAYRLRRAIPRTATEDALAVPRVARAPDVYVLLPSATADARSDARVRRVATSSRRGTNVALIAVSPEPTQPMAVAE